MMTSEREAELRALKILTSSETLEVWAALDEARGALTMLWNCMDRKSTSAAATYDLYAHKDDSMAQRITREMLVEMHLLKGIAFACGHTVLTALRKLK